MKQLFLVMGTQRSGTTLLSKALSTHPKIFVHNETWLPNLFKNMDPGASGLQERLRLFLENQRDDQDQSRDKNILGLKEPTLTYHMEQVKLAMKFAKVVIIIRDPRGVVNSYMENGWGLGTNAYTGALRWREEVNAQLALRDENPESTLLVRYEDLVSDMQNNLQEVCDFLNTCFDPRMLDYHRNKDYMRTSRESRHVNSAPSRSLSTKWRATLSAREVGIIETICRQPMESLSYTRIEKDVVISRRQERYFHLHQKIFGEIQLQYRLRAAKLKRMWTR